MRKQLDKNYDPTSCEERIYQKWVSENLFHTEAQEAEHGKKPFTIMMPPPNITGQLHIGHALDISIQDILTRVKRMQGYNTLWMPGTDHASISTELKIVESIKNEGLTKESIGRDEFLRRAWDWREKYGGRITQQLRKLGSSCDWDRERFTMDEGMSAAVLRVFVKLHKDGLIYRGERLINWCPKCKTSISDAEADHEDQSGFLYHFKYPVKDSEEFLEFATTRPETILGDTAIAVNPNDERYIRFVGKTVIVPIVNREIPVIADHYVDPEFGTGVVKITPAHDPNDFEVGLRHDLPRINILNDDGTLNSNAGDYVGLSRNDARERIIKDFEAQGLYIKKTSISHAVGVHERCGEVIEPMIKLQWFVKMDELAEPAINAYKDGKLRIVPERFGKIYLNWLENIRDWCISRQLWWGHRIPAYYCKSCGYINVAENKPDACEKCGCDVLTQDPDTLDTWFSSALWPFSTLGWPEETPELKYFYPTDVLVTAYDIIFFWVVRMVFSGLRHMGEVPFKDVLIHGLIRDSQGRKMSKSLGNGFDPLEIIEKYGADALRFSLITGNSPGNDMRFYIEKVEAGRNFSNKLWNAARFVLMNLDDGESIASELMTEDKWILSRVNSLAAEVETNIDNYELGIAAQKLYDFIWDEFCDWYIEMVKPRLRVKNSLRDSALWTLETVLIRALKMLHPFMPFVTEEIYEALTGGGQSIMISEWPKFETKFEFTSEEKEIELVKQAVKGVRNVRSEMNAGGRAKVYIVPATEEARGVFEKSIGFFKDLAFASEVIVGDYSSDDAAVVTVAGATLYIPMNELVDTEKEKARLNKEYSKACAELELLRGKLSNEGFMQKAPPELVKSVSEKLIKQEAILKQIEEQRNRYNR